MQYEEYESRINEVLADPDTALANIGEVMDNLKTDLTAFDEMKNTVIEQENRIKDLQETNLKLYLMQGGGKSEPDEDELPEKTGVDAINQFWEELDKED